MTVVERTSTGTPRTWLLRSWLVAKQPTAP
jgi:hypothetical protein